MENTNKSLTIAEMTKQHFEKHPEQPVESINEYLKSINESAKKDLKLKFKSDKEYYMQFQEAILHTSFIITVIVQKTLAPEGSFELEQYLREFLFFARKDDKDIYQMRMYYLNSLTAEEMGLGYVNPEDLDDLTDPIERDLVEKEAKSKQQFYDNLLGNVKKQYADSKIHLI